MRLGCQYLFPIWSGRGSEEINFPNAEMSGSNQVVLNVLNSHVMLHMNESVFGFIRYFGVNNWGGLGGGGGGGVTYMRGRNLLATLEPTLKVINKSATLAPTLKVIKSQMKKKINLAN